MGRPTLLMGMCDFIDKAFLVPESVGGTKLRLKLDAFLIPVSVSCILPQAPQG